MMKNLFFSKIIASFAICGLVVWSAGPALASTQYDPNDQYYDPSGTYVPPAPIEEVTADSTTTPDATSTNSQDAQATTNDDLNAADSTGSADAAAVLSEEGSDGTQVVTDGSGESGVDSVAANEETGSGSDNNASTEVENSTETTVDNDATVTTPVTATANSGQNEANMNTGNGGVETGDADLASNIVTAANTIISGSASFALPIINYLSDLVGDLVLDSSSASGADPNNLNLQQIVSNFLTGAGSDNDAESSIENNSDTDINNDGNLNNNLDLSANTGENSANMNTGDGSVATGDANIASNVVNFLNNSIFATNWWMGIVNIFGDWVGNLVVPSMSGTGSVGTISQDAQNGATGAYSDNSAISSLETNSETSLTNQAGIVDNVVIDANTGDNQAKGNTGDGTVVSGDANIKDNQLTIANNTVVGGSWWMMLVNTLDGWAGAIIGSPDGGTQFLPFLFGNSATNVETGPFSDNSVVTETEINSDTSIDNQAEVNNTLHLSANTGKNEANYNTGDGSVETGDANIISNLVNFVNNTFNVENWAFGIINVFGKWTGGVNFGADAVSDSATDVVPQEDSMTAINDATGAGSDNDAATFTETNQELRINNNLDIRKNLTVNANTGGNETDFNTGSGSVSTGDIDVESNMTTLGNITDITVAEGDSPSLEVLSQNSDTGSGSRNNAFTAICGKLKLAITNIAHYVKDIDMGLNTGDNSANMNTGGGTIVTGDITAVVKEKTVLNIVKFRQAMVEVVEEEEAMGGGEEENQISPLGEILPIAGGSSSVLISIFATIATMLLIRKKYL